MQKNQHTDHTPVLLSEVLKYLNPQPGETYLDATAGYGGHANAILNKTQYAQATLIDRDINAINYLAKTFKGRPIDIVYEDYLGASQQLHRSGRQFDLILVDLGVSSPHLNMASRGFSFQHEGPLDMRMDQNQSLSAAKIINTYNEARLSELIRRYGEEPHAIKIANAIVRHRPLSTTVELAKIIASAVPGKRGRVHPATRTFQALRIAVNSELEQLEDTLPIWVEMLNPGGRIVVISFHSLEDRLVKQYFLTVGKGKYDAVLDILTKHPITASHQEIAFNPRARSAKLRAAVKK